MIHNSQVLGEPLQQFNDIKTNIEAITGLPEGSLAWATDTDELLKYDGTTWTVVGTGTSTGKYRQFTYTVYSGDFSFITDSVGNPILALQDLE